MKKYTWCFAGQIHDQGDRAKMIDSLKKCNGEHHLHVADGWRSENSLSTQQYKNVLSDSIFVPCPRGNTSVDTFRLYEALEVGAIPIVEKSDYWRNLLGEHPLIETASWNNISNDINLLLENSQWIIEHSKKVQSWWIEYKQQLKQNIAKIIAAKRKVYDVCFCCDENLINYIINPINALSKKNEDKDITIHLIYSGKESELILLKEFIKNKNNLNLNVYFHDDIVIKTEKSWRSIDHLSNATNLKLKIPEILLAVSRVLYFDIDTIPFVDLSLFDCVELNESGIALKPEIKNGWRTFNGSRGTVTENKNPVEFGDKVIGNTGVMLLDLDLLRHNKFTEKCFEIKKTNTQKIPLTGGDQDIINIYCECDYAILGDNLNCLSSEQFVSINRDVLVSQNYETFCELGRHSLRRSSLSNYESFVLHFIGKDKPWNSDCPGADFWRKFSINKIPKKIFQTWKTKSLNDGLSFLSKSFQKKNPEYEYFLYDDGDCRQLIKENFEPIVLEVYDRIIPGAFKADLWRCCALYVKGGIFCDMDMICMTNFDSIINGGIDFFAPIDSNSKGAHDLYNAFMGSIPGHPILKRCIDTIVDNVINETWRKKKQLPLDFSACGVLGRCVNSYIGREDFSSFAGQMGIHKSVKILNYVKEHRYVEDEEGNKYVWSKDGNKKIQMIVRMAEKEYKAEPWILSVVGGKIPYKQKQEKPQIDPQKHKEFLRLKDEWSNLVDRDYLKYISKHLNQIQIPKEKFTTYNPGKKIAVVSLYTPEISDYAVCSEMSVRNYCLRQGYTFYVYREKLDSNASANWSKARAILNHFDDHEDIIWMDSDTIIYNPEKRFEDILARCTGTKKIIACEDIGANNKKIAKGMMLNSGVVIFRNHFYTKNIIKKWMNTDCDKSSLYASGGDQGILCDILKKSDGFGFNRKIFPMNEFNTEPRFVDENTFIVHFMAYPYELKKIFMRYFVSD